MPAGDKAVEPLAGEHPNDTASTKKNAVLIEIQQTSTKTSGTSHAGDVVAIDDELSDDECPSPTAEELVTLRRVANKIPAWLFTIAFIELCERFSYYGSTVVCKSNPQRHPQSTSTGIIQMRSSSLFHDTSINV
ncbi:hypothetical protein NQ176_g11268 [Zarea fungicola]|uniref:Uncharacterized protein n=1 Tax=Zarea fungicola TaxID=93591 RepID=A0ACC1MBN4_9HYPO|nr:hypothetical protein NQ176_g11268 [Lecanicillium fungicola]